MPAPDTRDFHTATFHRYTSSILEPIEGGSGDDLPCRTFRNGLDFAFTLFLVASYAEAALIEFTSNTLIDVNDMTYEGYDITANGCTLTVNGAHSFNSLTVIDNGTTYGVVTHTAYPNGEPYAMDLTIAEYVTVVEGCSIIAKWLILSRSERGQRCPKQ